MYVELANFGGGGLSTDRHPESLTSGEWTDLTNIDIRAGELTSPGAEVTQLTSCPIQPKWTFFYRTATGGYYVASDGEEVHSNDGTGWVELASGWGGGVVTYTVFLGFLVVNSSTDGPFYWVLDDSNPAYQTYHNMPDDPYNDLPVGVYNDGVDLTGLNTIPGWPSGATALQMIAYQNFLVALYVTDPARAPGTGPYLLMWSAEAQTGSIPSTWTASPENLAGDRLIQDTQAPLAGAALMRDDLMIYKGDGIYRLTYTGSPLFPMHLERVFTCSGVDYPYAIGVCSNIHYLVTRAGIQVFDGQQAVPLDYQRLQETVKRILAVATDGVSATVSYPSSKQLWIAYKLSAVDTYFGVLKYDVQANGFTVHNYSAEGMTSLCSAQIYDDTLTADLTYNAQDATPYNELPAEPYNPPITDPVQDTVFMAFAGGRIVRYDQYQGAQRYNGNAKVVSATKQGIRLAEARKRIIVRGVYPKIRGDGEVQISIGKVWEQNGAIKWGPERVFTPGTTRRIPYHEICDNFALRVTSRDGMTWRLAALGVEYDVLGTWG